MNGFHVELINLIDSPKQDGEERKIRRKSMDEDYKRTQRKEIRPKSMDEDYKRTQRKEISPRNINIGLYGLPRCR